MNFVRSGRRGGRRAAAPGSRTAERGRIRIEALSTAVTPSSGQADSVWGRYRDPPAPVVKEGRRTRPGHLMPDNGAVRGSDSIRWMTTIVITTLNSVYLTSGSLFLFLLAS